MNGYLYAIACGEMVKFGYSANPFKRMVKLQADNAGACTLLGVVPCLQKQEIELHALLSKFRVSGEWYPRGPSPIEFVISKLRALEAPRVARRVKPPCGPIQLIIDAFKTAETVSLSDLLSVDESHVRVMRARNSIPPEYWSRIVDAAAEHGIEGVTLVDLIRAREDRFRRKSRKAA
jgi:hypothetical protein